LQCIKGGFFSIIQVRLKFRRRKKMRYIAFLRGINVGGNKMIKMADLKTAMEKAGYTDVVTILASGNVLFSAAKNASAKDVEKVIASAFGVAVGVVLRTQDDIRKLVSSDPFKGITVTPDTRLYVTFLPPDVVLQSTPIPHDVRVVRSVPTEICSVVTVLAQKNTTDLMAWLDKTYGKSVTTRNWNTILRLLPHL
jgi:uncharacterized protein (DUF1697 family)